MHAYLEPNHYGPMLARAEPAPGWARDRLLPMVHSAADTEVTAARLDRAGELYAFLAHSDSSAPALAGIRASLRRMLDAEPAHLEALYQLGKLGALTGADLDAAEQAMRRYLEVAPAGDRTDGAHYRLGQIAEHRGDVEGARREYEAALALDPDYAAVRTALDALGDAGP